MLMGIDMLTGFAGGAALGTVDLEEVLRTMLHHFFASLGLPQLVVIDDGCEFKGTLLDVCNAVGISHWVVSKGNHKAIMLEWFHRFLNKV